MRGRVESLQLFWIRVVLQMFADLKFSFWVFSYINGENIYLIILFEIWFICGMNRMRSERKT